MIYVALALAAGWTVTVTALLGVLRSRDRQHARDRDLLLNQLLHACGKPWQPAPAKDIEQPPESRRTLTPPEQQPTFD